MFSLIHGWGCCTGRVKHYWPRYFLLLGKFLFHFFIFLFRCASLFGNNSGRMSIKYLVGRRWLRLDGVGLQSALRGSERSIPPVSFAWRSPEPATAASPWVLSSLEGDLVRQAGTGELLLRAARRRWSCFPSSRIYIVWWRNSEIRLNY